MTNTGRTLLNFLKNYCDYLPTADLHGEASTHSQVLHNEKCPICLTGLAESVHRTVQVNLSTCHHALDEDCFSRYILAGFTRCPLCRAEWYDLPEGASTNLSAISAEEAALQSVDALRDAMLDLRNFVRDLEGPADDDVETAALRSRILEEIDRADSRPSGPVGSGPLFDAWPEWAEVEGDVHVIHNNIGPLRGGEYRREWINNEHGRDVEELLARSARAGAPEPRPEERADGAHPSWEDWVDEEGDVGGRRNL